MTRQRVSRASRWATAVIVAVLSVAACDSTPPATPTVAPSVAPSPTAAPSPSSSPSPTPTPTPAATPGPTPTPTPSPPPAAGAWPYRTQREIAQTLFPADGRVVTVESDWAANQSAVMVLDAQGQPVAGWPWSTDSGSPIARAALGPEDTLYVAVRGAQGIPVRFTWSLHRLTPAAKEAPGFPVDLPSVSFCELQTSAGIAYVNCEQEDADGNTTGTILTAVRPDGSSPYPPVRLARSASLIGFGRNTQPILAIRAVDRTVIRALAADGSTAWSTRVVAGDAFVDPQGRIRVTRQQFGPDACGTPIRTTYDLLRPDGTRSAGWPLVVRGWASRPAVLDDGSMVIATAGDTAVRYTLRGRIAAGWPVRNVDVSFVCYNGSVPVVEGDRIVIVGAAHVTTLKTGGRVAGTWSTNPPGAIAVICPTCAPGGGETVAPMLGGAATYVATYDARDRPRVVTIGRAGVAHGAGVPTGARGAETMWLALDPARRIWAVTTDSEGDATTSRLSLVGVDPPRGP